MNNLLLIAYFSRAGNNYFNGKIVDLPVGNTEIAAEMIKELTVGQLFKIDPVYKYSKDYDTCTQEAKVELHANARPDLSVYLDSIDDYDTVILCYPNWWGTMPMPVWTFLEKYDFSGKVIWPLCTHEGSGMGRSECDIKKLCPNTEVRKGHAIHGSKVRYAEKEIAEWLDGINKSDAIS